MTYRTFTTVSLILASLVIISGCTQNRQPTRQYISTKSPEQLRQIREAYYNAECGRSALAAFQASQNADWRRAVSDVPIDEARAFYSNRTKVTHALLGGHGTQIEYTAEDGTAHLWYPGNKRVLHGKWKIERKGTNTLVCFAYGDDTYNPSTGHKGDSFECGSFHRQRMVVVDSVDGDPFALRNTDEVQHKLPKKAGAAYMPRCLPSKIPHVTDGKTIIEHLLEELPPNAPRPPLAS